MIQANELRTGNLVKTNTDTPVIIRSAAIAEIENRRVEVFPIPLTPEILEKWGFEANELKDDYRIELSSGKGEELSVEDQGQPSKNCCLVRNHREDGLLNGGFDYCYIKEITALHQLQNLYFALTGKELKIDL